MTAPGNDLGSASVEVHADTDPFERELERGVRRGADAADDDLKDAGKKFGHTIGDSMGDELEKAAPTIARRVEKSLDKEDVHTRRWTRLIRKDIEDAFGDAASNIGQTISSAIGSAFNVSGRGGLIFLLLPLIGALGFLIAGLIQGVYALISLLAVIPGLLVAIGVEAGVLFLAFKNVGGAIQAAFEAKNAKELKEAIKDLTPSAQNFVKSLLPLKGLFDRLQKTAQEGFFREFGNAITKVTDALGPILLRNMDKLAGALGVVAGSFALAFASPSFTKFLEILLPSAVKWLNDFALTISYLGQGFSDLAIAAQPFFDAIGKDVNQSLQDFGKWLSDISKDKDFKAWLEDMRGKLHDLWYSLSGIGAAIKEFAKAVDEANGGNTLKDIGDFFFWFAGVMKDPEFKKGIEGIIDFLKFLTAIAFAELLTLVWIFAKLEEFGEWLKNTFWPWFKDDFWPGFLDIMSHVGEAVLVALNTIVQIPFLFWEGLMWLGTKIGEWLAEQGKKFWNWITVDVPNAFKKFIDDAPGLLFSAGRNIVEGLKNGIKEGLGGLGTVMKSAATTIRNFLPFSPAKEGPLSGAGDPMKSGQKIIDRLASGIQMESPALRTATNSAVNNIVFGPGAVQVGFNGALPTAQQAETTGAAAGRGIMGQLALRDTQLQVRMASANG